MGHYWPMSKTAAELLTDLGASIRARRLAQFLSQEQAASRAGLGLRTWRRLERDGHATTETLVHVAVFLRREQGLESLLPLPAAVSLDDLLKQQAREVQPCRQRAPRTLRPCD